MSLRFPVRSSAMVQAAAGLLLAALITAPQAGAQFAAPPRGTQVHDSSALKPPAGSHVAIIAFVDLECPDCARANPLLREAAAHYKIPLVHHDFPLPFHSWSMQAAINARWFDLKGKKVGDEYRDAVFANQPTIADLTGLRAFTEKFATEHKLVLPFAVDPQGKLQDKVKADYALGQRIGIEHTPTIWVVTTSSNAAPFVEVVDRSKLYQLIDQALVDTKGETPAPSAHR